MLKFLIFNSFHLVMARFMNCDEEIEDELPAIPRKIYLLRRNLIETMDDAMLQKIFASIEQA